MLLIAYHHGNEPFGEHVYNLLKTKFPEDLGHVEYLVANEKAMSQNVRYTESDMNRSYGVSRPTTYEEVKASQLLKYIDSKNYDLILDCHNTTCEMPPTAIAKSYDNPEVKDYIGHTNIEHMVVLNIEDMDTSLIGRIDNSFAVESNIDESEDNAPDIANALHAYINDQMYLPKLRNIYEDVRYIPKTKKSIAENYTNFKLSNQGFYPILIGNNSYRTDDSKSYIGFGAFEKTKIIL